MTSEEINSMTDEQINVMVTAAIYGLSDFYGSGVFTKGKNKTDGTVDSVMTDDYCNDPAVMWPIIVENEISIIKEENKGVHFACMAKWDGWELNTRLDTRHQNPLRAAAIVYLKIKGVL